MADSVDRVFVHALNTVKRLPRTGSARPPSADRLRLYGLYKQSTEGDVEGTMAKPEGKGAIVEDGVSELEKWQSWKSNSGISRTEAKRLYIVTLIDIMHRYATTTSESRELAAELEFVWDQIKSSPDSSAASPADLQVSQSGMRSSGALPSERESRLATSDGLQILRPLSDGNEDDALNSDVELDDDAMDEELRKLRLSECKSSRSKAMVMNPIERALTRMSVEVAALREQLEAGNFGTRQLRSRAGRWVFAIVGPILRHVLIDTVLFVAILFWARRSHDPIISQSYRLLLSWLREKARKLRRLAWS